MVDLSGKVFVVTGGNGGIGLGMAEGIVSAGGSVAIWGRNEAKNEAAVAGLKALGGRAVSLICDVSDEQQVAAAMRESVESLGRLDGLFANAGRTGGGTRFVDLSLEDWRSMMAVNLDGVFLTLREAARVLVEQDEGGSLVAVSSTSAIHGAAGNEAYGTAKTGLNGLVRALAVGLARHQIRVNALLPGWTKTELAGPLFANDAFREATTKRTPVRRWADPSEFREVAAFLADPSQTFHTGQEICVDGGYTVF
jgi:NAD(P)-dependent dehydrogenase (short-subunit alcohol dehydrogenase family)